MRAQQKNKEEKKDVKNWKKKRLSSFKMDADPLGTWAKSGLVSDWIEEEKSSRSHKKNIITDSARSQP